MRIGRQTFGVGSPFRRTLGTFTILVLGFAGCSAKGKNLPADATAPRLDTLAALWQKPIPEGKGILFGSGPGARVPAWRGSGDAVDGGADIFIDEGTEVLWQEDNADADQGVGTVIAQVTVNGALFRVQNDNLLTEDHLKRSPNNQIVVFTPIYACGDLCHYTVWILTRTGRKLITKDTGVQPLAAFSPDHQRVVIGADQLWSVLLPDLSISEPLDFTSPSFAPNGQLFVRGVADDGVYRLGGPGKPTRLFAARKPQDEEGSYGVDVAPPITFEDNGQTLVAPLWRNGQRLLVRLNQQGKVLSRKIADEPTQQP